MVARLDTKGSLDESFGTGGRKHYTGLPIWSADAIVVPPDGKIAIAGSSPNGITVARLKTDGSPDGTEYAYAGSGYPAAAALTKDGKIVITGYTDTSAPPTTTSWSRASPPTGSWTRWHRQGAVRPLGPQRRVRRRQDPLALLTDEAAFERFTATLDWALKRSSSGSA